MVMALIILAILVFAFIGGLYRNVLGVQVQHKILDGNGNVVYRNIAPDNRTLEQKDADFWRTHRMINGKCVYLGEHPDDD